MLEWIKSLFRTHEHCWHEPVGWTGDPMGTVRVCCYCPRVEKLVPGPLEDHGPYTRSTSNKVWKKVTSW